MSRATDPAGLLEAAVEAACEAADLLVAHRRGGTVAVTDTKSSPTDVVTTADAASEALLRARLYDGRPGDGWLGEESGAAEAAARHEGVTSGVRWIVDPLDGTVNYLYDLPGWAVSVAAEVDGQVVAGCVVVPSAGEVFAAVLGGGGTCNGQPLTVSGCTELSQALVATGFSYEREVRSVQGEVVARLLPEVRDIRRFGAAAVDFCSLAAGRVDAFYEAGLKPWDRAAGALIAREAGATVTEGDDGSVIAASPAIFEPVRRLVAASGSGIAGQSSGRSSAR
jgi:myo-inositol-1(or 4)-monophosphatase